MKGASFIPVFCTATPRRRYLRLLFYQKAHQLLSTVGAVACPRSPSSARESQVLNLNLCVNPASFLPLALRWVAGIWGEDEEGGGSSVRLDLIQSPALPFGFFLDASSVVCWSQSLLAKLSL